MSQYSNVFVRRDTRELLDRCKDEYLRHNSDKLQTLGIHNKRISYDLIIRRIAEIYLE